MNIDFKNENQIPDGFFDFPLPIERVLYEAEQPIVYVTKTKQGQEMLAYLADESNNCQFIVVTPATAATIRRLECGSLGVREALTETWMWMVQVNFDTNLSKAWSITESEIPEFHLPKPDTPLLPEHGIAFSARAIGNGISLGRVPCSVIAFVANAAKSSLKTILDNVLATNGEGRPTDTQRALYDLPVQSLRFASFEIGLSAPKQDMFPNDPLLEAVRDLQIGLKWAADTDDSDTFDFGSDEAKTEAILRATLALTPPTHGAITSIEIGGFWLNSKFTLTRQSRAKVAKKIKLLNEEEIVVLYGRIGEIDDDKLSFILRDVENESSNTCSKEYYYERRGSFSEDLLEDMRSHYFDGNRVKISGVLRAGKLSVTAVVHNHDR